MWPFKQIKKGATKVAPKESVTKISDSRYTTKPVAEVEKKDSCTCRRKVDGVGISYIKEVSYSCPIHNEKIG